MPDRMPKAVLFDWDGTLVNSWPIIHESMNRTLEAMGHPVWTMEETTTRVRKSLREAFPELFGDRWEDARDIFYGAYREVHLERVEKIDGADEMLALLQAHGSISVLSAINQVVICARNLKNLGGIAFLRDFLSARLTRRGISRQPTLFTWRLNAPASTRILMFGLSAIHGWILLAGGRRIVTLS